jgi:hypothetical protein
MSNELIGRSPGKIAVVLSPSVKAAMVKHDPVETMRAIMASLPQSVTFCWKRTIEDYRIDPEYGYEPLGERILVVEFANASGADIDASRDILLQSCGASDYGVILAELGRLRVSTASRNAKGEDTKTILRVYGDRIARFPQDIAVSVIRKWSDTEKWWPSLGELVTRMDELMSERRAMLDQLEAHG